VVCVGRCVYPFVPWPLLILVYKYKHVLIELVEKHLALYLSVIFVNNAR
jgi:hypothetical protein